VISEKGKAKCQGIHFSNQGYGRYRCWVYGHTHTNFDGEVCGTRVVCNQAGYPGERVDGFDAGFVVEL